MINFIQLVEIVLQLTMIVMVGLYFIFSNTIMSTLKNHSVGADVMVEINRMILNPVFMMMFIGSAIASLYFLLFGNMIQAISGAIFFLGTTMVTVIKNVPLNNHLRDANLASDYNPVWSSYLDKWVFWNHIRTGSAITASIFLLI